jgi:protein-disulfide isomerase
MVTLKRREFLAVAFGLAPFAGAVLGRPRAALAEAYATGDMALGSADAPVTVIEYASMTCPHCARFHAETFPDLKSRYIETGKVRFIYREFPLDEPALRASMLARCAGEKRFFGFIDVLFRQQDNWRRARDPIGALAKLGRVGGIGKKAFEACMTDRALGDSILATRLNGSQKFEINSTPSFVINGKMHPGAFTIEQFADIIDPLVGGD